MSTEVKSLVEDLNKTVVEYREALDTKADASVLEKMTARMDVVQKQLDEVHLAGLNANNNTSKRDERTSEIVSKGIRKGFDKLTDVELKAVSDPALRDGDLTGNDGGFAVPQDLRSQIIARKFESNPLRTLANVVSTTSNKVEMLVENDDIGYGWVGEEDLRPNTAVPKIDKAAIELFEIYANPKATHWILEDASFDIEAWLVNAVGAKLARAEAAAFMSGDGVKKPLGLLSSVGTTSDYKTVKNITTAGAALAGDDILDLIYDIQTPYLEGACFLLPRASLAKVRGMKDANGNYLWQTALTAGQPSSLAGFPVYQAEDLPAYGSGAVVALFGNFKEAYTIVDKPGAMFMIRDNVTDKRYVQWYMRDRVGGGVVRAEAIRALTLA